MFLNLASRKKQAIVRHSTQCIHERMKGKIKKKQMEKKNRKKKTRTHTLKVPISCFFSTVPMTFLKN